MEGLVSNGGRLVPIWEFRDLDGITGIDLLRTRAAAYETAIIQFHQKYAQAPRTRRSLQDRSQARRRIGDSCKAPSTSGTQTTSSASSTATSRCPEGQAAVGDNGECRDCPEGQSPSEDGQRCTSWNDHRHRTWLIFW